MAEHDQTFRSFDEWVSKASSWLTRRGEFERAVCFDAFGRVCQNGAHFMRARDEGAFPVRWIWPNDNPAPVLKHPTHDSLLAELRKCEDMLCGALAHAPRIRDLLSTRIEAVRALIAKAEGRG